MEKASLKEGQTVLVLDEKDIALVIKEDGNHSIFISSMINEDEETVQNTIVALIASVLKDPKSHIEILKKSKSKES